MNKDLFSSMQEQMSPSPEVRSALARRLAQAQPRKNRDRAWKYGALAACAALVIAAYPLYRMTHPPLHSYISGEAVTVTEAAIAKYDSGAGSAAVTIEPASGEDTSIITEHNDGDGSTAVTIEPASGEDISIITEHNDGAGSALLPTAPGGLVDYLPTQPGGTVTDVPAISESQEWALAAYQNLMDRFEQDYGPDAYPDWYGGAYLDENTGLVVLIVETYEPEDKALFLQIQDWAGSDKVAFGSANYSLSHLYQLRDQAVTAMSGLDLSFACGINEQTNQVELDLSTANSRALAVLAKLDPADDAILVRVGTSASTNDASSGAAVSHNAVRPGGITSDLDGDPTSYEPAVSDLPQEKQPAHYDLPEIPDDAASSGDNTPSYDPQA